MIFTGILKNSPDKSNRPEISTKLLLSAAVAFCLAGIIAYELDIRNCETINMSSYDNNYDRRPDDKIELHADLSGVDEQTLIIDDLSDSGRTFRILRGMFPKAKFVSVYAKPQGAGEVDIYAERLPDEWIVFPWDL